MSVVVPVFNGANYLREAIDSVLSQTYPNIEVIVVDDGSQDSTWEIIQLYGTKLRGFRKQNGGVASALNVGIMRARGEFIAWLSHDDLFLPQKIEQQVRFMLQRGNCGVCYTNFEVVDAKGFHVKTIEVPWFPRQEMPRQFLRNMYINGSTTLIRKACFDRVGFFNEQLAYTQDLDMWLRISIDFEFCHLPRALIKSRSHPTQGSRNFESQITEEKVTFLEIFHHLGPSKIFPELTMVQNPPYAIALSYEKFGNEMLIYRHWYQFAREQYQQSLKFRFLGRTWMKVAALQVVLRLLGNELDALLLVKQARFSLYQGDCLKARKLSARMLLHHPFRLDAFIIWIGTWITPRTIQALRSVKRRITL